MRQPNSDVYARSAPHRKVERIITAMGLWFESEYPFPPYTVDIYLNEWHIAIEVDGPYHSKKKDKNRDQNLLDRYGLHLLRLDTKQNFKPDVIEAKILAFIDQHYEDVEVRKRVWLTQH